MKTIAAISCVVFLSACETPTAARYSIAADNTVALRASGAKGIAIGKFTPPGAFEENCRALGPVRVPDNMTHTQYIKKAFEDELKVADIFAHDAPRVVLTGKVNRLEFSSMRGVTGGSWTINLLLMSTNGATLNVNEYYEFDTGFMANDACRQTAEAFPRAVQDLIGKAVRNPQFLTLVR